MGHSNMFVAINADFMCRTPDTFLLRRPFLCLNFIIFAQVLASVVCTNMTDTNDTNYDRINDVTKALPDQQSSTHLELSSPNDIILENTWRYRSFPGIKIPVVRSPHPTFGSPWPLPWSWSSSSCYYNVDMQQFHFEFHTISNEILQSAVNRYTFMIRNKLGFSVYPKVWQHNEKSLFSHFSDNYQSTCENSPVKRNQDFRDSSWKKSSSSFRANRHYSSSTNNNSHDTNLKTSNDISHNFISEQMSHLIRKYKLSEHSIRRRGIQNSALLHVINPDSKLPHVNMDESYILGVTENGIFIISNETWGALRGLETLSQLMWTTKDQSHVFVNRTYIVDYPRFKHRGLMIDTSRHFISKSVILLNLEAMSYNKLNVLHWHIVDDQSFPYQSDVYPELSAKGAYREDLVYTSNDIKEIVEFARFRGIRVIPEFDIPGHTRSLSLSHPEIMSQCQYDYKNLAYYGPLNPASNKTYELLENLFNEVFQLFLDDYIHLGGDEVETICWERDPEILQGVENHDQSNSIFWINYFWRCVQNLVTQIGKKNPQSKRNLILWEDVVEHVTDLKKSLFVQVWKSHPLSHLSKGFNIIYSSCWYLDLLNDIKRWTDFYLCDPSNDAPLETEQQILGGEACMWSEYQSDDTVLTKIWPVTSAVAERLWSAKEINDLEFAGPRIEEQRCRLINRGIPAGVLLGPGYCDSTKQMTTWNIDEIILDEYKNIKNIMKRMEPNNNNHDIYQNKNNDYRPINLWSDKDLFIGIFIGILITSLFRHRNFLPFRMAKCNLSVIRTVCLCILIFVILIIFFNHMYSVFV
ncbi:unnamed protein product [Schistosoma bovis]|nr:unnamed protein product [Schistosoma bovis]